MTVDARHLRAFTAIVAERSITRAATGLHLSQPAVSRLLRQLETHVGERLVDRSTHHLEVTAVGQRYAVQAAAALRALDAALAPGALGDQPIRVGHAWSGFGNVTGQILTSWQSHRPGSPVLLRRFDDRLAGLLSGETDAAVVRDLDPDLPVARAWLTAEPRVAALPVRHGLAAGSSLTLTQLSQERLVINTVSGTTPVTLWGTRSATADTVPVVNTDDWLFAIAAGHGVGVTSVATSTVHATPEVVYVPLTDAPPVDVELAWPRPVTHPHLNDFVDHLTAAFTPRRTPD